MSEIKYLDLAGLTAYDAKIKEWIKSGVVDIAEDAIRELFVTSAYRMVDLGLPSGLKWADRNVGAETPQDNGLYFSWGNIDGHAVDENGNVTDGYSFDENTYSTTIGGQYTGSELDAEHDAATTNMGSGWRMPTNGEIIELINNTTQTFIDLDGNEYSQKQVENGAIEEGKLKGVRFTSSNGNSIFMPAAGLCNESLLIGFGVGGLFWSSSLASNNMDDCAWQFSFDCYEGITGNNGINSRYLGISIRGVHA